MSKTFLEEGYYPLQSELFSIPKCLHPEKSGLFRRLEGCGL
jgi:hypothetical protein